MCRAQCVLALVAMYVGLVHSSSWDFATAAGTDLEFYFGGEKTYTQNITTSRIEKITYDPVGNRMFFYGNGDKFNFIFSYDMTTKKTAPLVYKPHENERVEGIAFDPVDQILFWNVFYSSTIYSLSLKSRFENTVAGNFLIKTSDQGPSTIAIDSCNGYIYWMSIDTIGNKVPSLIERARFDGSDREVVINTGLQKPKHLAIDPQTQRLYWTDGTRDEDNVPPIHKKFSIESSDLNGQNRTVLYHEIGQNQPWSFAITEYSIYWSHYIKWTAWKLSKTPSIHAKPQKILISAWSQIVTNYKIEQQLRGVQTCDRLKSLLQNDEVTVENDSDNVVIDTCLDCVHETKASGESQCKCKHGNVSEKCEVPVCHNYCFQGDCSVSDKGEPQCRCNAGYSGQRCEDNVCQGHCLNAGDCVLNEGNAPICQCRADYEGERCEVSACLNRLNKHFQTVSMLRDVLNADSPSILDRRVKSTCAANIF